MWSASVIDGRFAALGQSFVGRQKGQGLSGEESGLESSGQDGAVEIAGDRKTQAVE